MIISYHGMEFFKVQFGDAILAFNPISKKSKLKGARFGANIALITLDHPDMNGAENVFYGEKAPFIISGPGEYEISGIFIKGYPTESFYGGGKRINTIYTVSLEGMNICFLGALGKDLEDEDAEESLDGIDVLFVPIGGNGVLDPALAYKVAVNLEPKLIIPMHYGEGEGASKALKVFLKEAGEEKLTALDKLTLKKKDLEGKEAEIALLAEV